MDNKGFTEPCRCDKSSILKKGRAFFLAIKLGMREEITPKKESTMDFLNTFIAVIAVLITLFREEIRKIFFKSKK